MTIYGANFFMPTIMGTWLPSLPYTVRLWLGAGWKDVARRAPCAPGSCEGAAGGAALHGVGRGGAIQRRGIPIGPANGPGTPPFRWRW